MRLVECIGFYFQFSLELSKSHANRREARIQQKATVLDIVRFVGSKINRCTVILAGHREEATTIALSALENTPEHHHVASLYTKPAFVREISVVLTPR
jgi:hypothetical protein